MQEKEKPFRVLSIDGGGMRGVYAVAFLDALSKKGRNNIPEIEIDLGKGFDLIAGTSTGGIIAAGLAAGKTTTDILGFYQNDGEKIFSSPTPAKTTLFGKVRFAYWLAKNLRSSANKNDPLKSSLKQVFGDENMEDLFSRRGIALCIPSIAMSNHSCSVFKTPHHPDGKLTRDNKLKIVDVCLATSAAPIILPVASITDPQKNAPSSYVDGGLCANNPVLIALTEALLLAGDRRIEIISIGTCPPAPGSMVSEHNRGVLGWSGGISALEVSMDAQAGLVNATTRLLIDRLGIANRVTLIRPEASTIPCDMVDKIGLDRASKEAIDSLINLAHFDADKVRGASLQQENPTMKKLTEIFEDLPQKEKTR